MSAAAPFYNSKTVQLYVHSTKTLRVRLKKLDGVHDTGFITLPSTYISDNAREKFRFYTVLNNSHDDENKFGLWIYVFHPSFNYQINDCTFSVVKGLNTVALAPTTVSDSVVGIYQAPCHHIVNNESILDFLIHFPVMTFKISDGDTVKTPKTKENQEIDVDVPRNGKQTKKITEVNLGDELSSAFKQVTMEDTNYDVHFVVDGEKIGSFKFILCAVSDVFSAALKSYTKEAITGKIEITDFEPDIVRKFVDALHTHKICFNSDPIMILQLALIANKYNVKCIEKAAHEAFNPKRVFRHNFIDVYRLAAYDSGLMGRLMKRFVEMNVDAEEINGFEGLTERMQADFYRSAFIVSIDK